MDVDKSFYFQQLYPLQDEMLKLLTRLLDDLGLGHRSVAE